MAQILIDRELCKGCGQCVGACPQHVLAGGVRLNAKGFTPPEVVEPWRCLGCRLCGIACPDLAIRLTVTGTLYRYFDY